MQANNGTHDECQQEGDDHTMKANKMLTRCKNIENQDEFDEDDESDTMKEINQLFKPPPIWTKAHVIIHPFRGAKHLIEARGPPMNATMSKQEFKEAWAKDTLNEVAAKQAKDKLNEVVAKDKLNEVEAKQACKDAWANEAKAQASWAKAHGKEATNANGYLSIAEIRCDERTKRIMKAHTCSKNSPPQSSK